MTFLIILIVLLLVILILYLNRWSGWRKDIKKQIEICKDLKRQMPDAQENNLASRLLRLKINSHKTVSFRNYIEPLATQSGVTLSTALFFIIEYDYIRKRRLDPSEPGPTIFLQKVKDFIDMVIAEEFPKGT